MKRAGAVLFGLSILATSGTSLAQPGGEINPDTAEDPAPEPEPAPEPLNPAPPPEPAGPAPQPVPTGPAPVPVAQPPGGSQSFETMTPGFRAHDGILVRGVLGVAYQALNREFEGTDFTASGVATHFAASLGYSIRPGFAVHLDVAALILNNPTVTVGDMSADGEGTSLTLGIGPGASYYLGSNAYVAGALLFGEIQFSDEDGNLDPSDSTDAGVSLALTGGKEWWIGSDLGVGVVGNLMFGGYAVEGSDEGIGSFAVSLNGSVTFN